MNGASNERTEDFFTDCDIQPMDVPQDQVPPQGKHREGIMWMKRPFYTASRKNGLSGLSFSSLPPSASVLSVSLVGLLGTLIIILLLWTSEPHASNTPWGDKIPNLSPGKGISTVMDSDCLVNHD